MESFQTWKKCINGKKGEKCTDGLNYIMDTTEERISELDDWAEEYPQSQAKPL